MEKSEILNVVSDFPLFSKLKKEQLKKVVEHAVVTVIPKNAVFFSEDKYAQGMHILLYGRVKLFKISEDGKEQTIFVFGPGEPFCLCSVFSDGILPANLGALEDSHVLAISPVGFEQMVQEDPTILINMMRVMSRRLKEAMDMIDSLSLKSLPSRLAAYLLNREKDGKVAMNFSYRELSKIVGATPEALSRALKKMSQDGLIEVDGAVIHILDPSGLEQ
ncbi:Crp/Fnr family transcriptional regulator [Pseudodesulfovibrio sediminis]|uniref:Transcriptional regulator n=1 Tax=Pseudodesulfovibrio sediminis TaxID=2810563 RepID=A0ABN6ENH0_9BACT|nr:Crp/Fnr family transcriptional regulator [Pseudodesulfovibrio sediminis]BCS87777.1 transcriptional regulator [Pseudodesulfovibrio sediminis]